MNKRASARKAPQHGTDRYVAIVDDLEIAGIAFFTHAEALAYAMRVAELTPLKHKHGPSSAYRKRWTKDK